MSNWNIKDLQKWDDKIIEIAKDYGLDWYDINYEICDYYEMIGHMSYHGMPSHYQHWSFGKTFERTHQMYNLGMSGLPYELIINSNPSIAYLMQENPLYLQILIMAHCIGHSDFFKNNRIFKDTDADNVVSRFRNARRRIQKYSENTNIGQEKVEALLTNLHSISFQVNRYGLKRLTRRQKKQAHISRLNKEKALGEKLIIEMPRKTLYESDDDILAFLMEYGKFDDWELDIINIVREESFYFIPQIRTKILNEGWASFWHYKIVHDLNLDQSMHLPFLKMHNAVVRPHASSINPYHLGFYIFNKIEKEQGLDECFFIRENQDDESAVRCHLDIEDCRNLNLFSYALRKDHYEIEEVSDSDGWKKVKNDLINSTGINNFPKINVEDIEIDGTLVLKHEHAGRDLDIEYADKVMSNIQLLWKDKVKMYTILEDDLWEM